MLQCPLLLLFFWSYELPSLSNATMLQSVRYYIQHLLTVCMHVMSSQVNMLCQVHLSVINMYHLLLLFMYKLIMSSWCSWASYLIYIHFFLLINNIHPEYATKSITWGKFYFCLSHVNSKPYQPVTYLSWSGPCLPFYRPCAAVCGHVCWCIVGDDAVWFVITWYMPEDSCLALLGGVTWLLSSPQHYMMHYYKSYVPLGLLYMTWVFCHALLALSYI